MRFCRRAPPPTRGSTEITTLTEKIVHVRRQRRFSAALMARLRLGLATNDRASPIPIGSARETRAPRLEQRARGTRNLVT